MKLSKTPHPTVFEISDVHIPEHIAKEFLLGLEYINHYENGNNIRAKAHINLELEEFIESTINALSIKFREALLELSATDFHHWWPTDIYECFDFGYDSDLVSAGIFKDSPNFNMGMHVDNGLSLGTSIINLVNQNAYTVYYTDDTGNSISYKGPTKRGTGIVHLNHPGLWHSGYNEADEERFILMAYYAVNNNICGQNH